MEVLTKLFYITKRFLSLLYPVGAGSGEDPACGCSACVQDLAVGGSVSCANPSCLDRWQPLCHWEPALP